MSEFKGQTGLKRILNAAGYSLDGLRAAFLGEAAFRQLVLLNLLLIPSAFVFEVSRAERALMVAVCLLALIVELLNSAIEAAIDAVIAANPDKVQQAKAKPQAIGWFVGQVMKATGGKANPAAVNDILKAKLGL